MRRKQRINYGAGLFSNAFQNGPASNSFYPGANFSNPQAFQPHNILSTASRLATPFLKSMNNPDAFRHPVANTAYQVFNQAKPLFNRFMQDPQGALNSVRNHPATNQLMSLVNQHLPYVQQAVQTAFNQPNSNSYNGMPSTRNNSYSRQTNQYSNPWQSTMSAPQNAASWNTNQQFSGTPNNSPNYFQGYRGGGKSQKRRRTRMGSRRRS
ncbi:MAG: hypothetical protein EOP45_16250, partial [Sphingobacteriaceae bacterium]